MTKVMVFGTFDGLHSGHRNFFRQARKYGDYLIVVVARDKTVKKVKKHLPRLNEKQRLKGVKNCELANKVALGGLTDPYEIIKKIKPDVICLGYDQKAFVSGLKEELKRVKSAIKIFKLKPYKPKIYHTSKLRKN